MSRVYKFVTAKGTTRWYVCVTYRGQRYREVGGDTRKAALKRLRELEARLEKTGKVTEKKERKGRAPALAAFETRPAELTVTFKGTTHKATVNADGTITVNDKTFNSPSRAGKEVTGREVDGWTFWSYEVPGEGLKKLDALRKATA